MTGVKIEAIVASPPERDELVVQLFTKDGGQWAEIFRDQDTYWIEFYGMGQDPMKFRLEEMIDALSRSFNELRERLGDTAFGT
jgi:arsenate reductase-like glutaredoxin family protein